MTSCGNSRGLDSRASANRIRPSSRPRSSTKRSCGCRATAAPAMGRRGHFFAAAALAMRRILVERARHYQRIKHGGGAARGAPRRLAGRGPGADRMVAVDEALTQLERTDPRKAKSSPSAISPVSASRKPRRRSTCRRQRSKTNGRSRAPALPRARPAGSASRELHEPPNQPGRRDLPRAGGPRRLTSATRSSVSAAARRAAPRGSGGDARGDRRAGRRLPESRRVPSLDMSAVDGPLQPGTDARRLSGAPRDRLGRDGRGLRGAAGSAARTVAIKVLRRGFRHPEILRRFEREADVLGRLQHPASRRCSRFTPARRVPAHLVMELVDRAADYRIRGAQGLGDGAGRADDACARPSSMRTTGSDASRSQARQRAGSADGRPKILDFGIARATGMDVRTSVTAHGQLLGTLAYMSPEQLRGVKGDVDGAATCMRSACCCFG